MLDHIRSTAGRLAHGVAIGSALLATSATLSPALASANEPGQKCNYTLSQSGGETGSAEIKINGDKLKVKIRDAQPNKLYTVWFDFRTRATGSSLPDGFPSGVRAVGPAMAASDGVSNGIGLDVNGIFTDEDGDAQVNIKLDYELLQPAATPIVGGLTMQGLNIVGGYWLRQYPADPDVMASSQIVTEPFAPALVYSTAAGITMVRHDDTITHGLAPGVKNVDHFSAWNGDFPGTCLL